MNVSRPLITIVVPVFNEGDNLRLFYDAVTDVIRTIPEYDWGFIFVDDGSRDGSFEVLSALRARDERVQALRFPRNFGSHVAIAAGIDYCRGDAAVVMAADLQDPPALIRDFVDRWRSGHDVVWGARTGRDEGDVLPSGAALCDSHVSGRRNRKLLFDFPPGDRCVPPVPGAQSSDLRVDCVERVS